MHSRKAILSGALVATGILLTSTVVVGEAIAPPGAVPTSCQLGVYTVEVTGGPSVVSCTDSTTGVCTEIEYTVSFETGSTPDHVISWQGVGIVYAKGDVKGNNGVRIFSVGEPDNLTNAGGDYAQHEQVVRINPKGVKDSVIKIGLAGIRGTNATSILIKKGSFLQSGRILGLGLEAGPGPLDISSTFEELQFGNLCTVRVSTPIGGEVVVELTQESIDAGCVLEDEGVPLDQVTITTPGHSGTGLQAEEFSFVSEGSRCWSFVKPPPNGKVYTVCK